MRPPLLVTGTHRSGSTWVGRLLAFSDEVHYIAEPLNVTTRPSWLRTPAERWYQYLPTDDPRWSQLEAAARLKFPVTAGVMHATSPRIAASATKSWINATNARVRNRRALFKDPFMVFNVRRFQQSFASDVIFTVRHPAAFASSLNRMDWPFDFEELVAQEQLLAGPLSPWRDELVGATKRSLTILEQACLLWRVVNGTVHALSEESGDRIVLVHERFAPRVEQELPALYERLGLRWTDDVEQKMAAITRGSREGDVSRAEVTALERDSKATASIWRSRLSPADVEMAEQLAMPEFEMFYA